VGFGKVGQGMKVAIYSDVVCPWCAIGKRRFESAMSRFEHADEVEVEWRAFELDPNAPRRREGTTSAGWRASTASAVSRPLPPTRT